MDIGSIFGAFYLGVLAACLAEYFRRRDVSLLTNIVVGVGGALLGVFIAGLLDLELFSGFWISFAITGAAAALPLTLVGAFAGQRVRR